MPEVDHCLISLTFFLTFITRLTPLAAFDICYRPHCPECPFHSYSRPCSDPCTTFHYSGRSTLAPAQAPLVRAPLAQWSIQCYPAGRPKTNRSESRPIAAANKKIATNTNIKQAPQTIRRGPTGVVAPLYAPIDVQTRAHASDRVIVDTAQTTIKLCRIDCVSPSTRATKVRLQLDKFICCTRMQKTQHAKSKSKAQGQILK